MELSEYNCGYVEGDFCALSRTANVNVTGPIEALFFKYVYLFCCLFLFLVTCEGICNSSGAQANYEHLVHLYVIGFYMTN